MSVALTPSSYLGFHRPLTQHVKRALAITNHNAQPVAFKVKTTAPKLYCVRPNSGRVEPGETVEVQVMLQAMKEEPPLNVKCKDKFLIQSTIITPEKETMPLQDLWADNAEEVHSQKVRVAYLPPEGQTVPEEEEGGPSELLDHSRSIYGTVRQHPNGNGVPEEVREPSGEAAREEEIHHDAPSSPPPPRLPQLYEESLREEPSREVVEEEAPVVNVNVHTPQPPPPSDPAAPDPNEGLFIKLREAQAEIERLRNLISSMPEPSTAAPTTVTNATELRRRRPTSPSDDGSTWDGETEVGTSITGTTTMEDTMMPPEGVPLQVVIIIALGVFVTTYLFF
ncbi:VAMP-associated protein [Daedalea quercina L-15889]|uniref:VAMP-associated protein n=1 Tax=Daedalea quercina L-15889 TaxID=1314783 RepID=A0A165TTC6_9APHY|nr:VAMP-associated protein [Daedalea quercina L-15889]